MKWGSLIGGLGIVVFLFGLMGVEGWTTWGMLMFVVGLLILLVGWFRGAK